MTDDMITHFPSNPRGVERTMTLKDLQLMDEESNPLELKIDSDASKATAGSSAVGGWMQAAAGTTVAEADAAVSIETHTNPFARESYYPAEQVAEGNTPSEGAATEGAEPNMPLKVPQEGEQDVQVSGFADSEPEIGTSVEVVAPENPKAIEAIQDFDGAKIMI